MPHHVVISKHDHKPRMVDKAVIMIEPKARNNIPSLQQKIGNRMVNRLMTKRVKTGGKTETTAPVNIKSDPKSQTLEIEITYKHTGSDFILNRNASLQESLKEFAAKNGLDYLTDVHSLFMSICEHLYLVDKMHGLPEQAQENVTYQYQIIADKPPNGRVYMAKLVSPELAIILKPEDIAKLEVKAQEEKIIDMPDIGDLKKTIGLLDEGMEKLDKWLLAGELLSTNRDVTENLRNLRNSLSKYHDPISTTLKTGEAVEKGAMLAYAMTEVAKYPTGSLAGLEKLISLAGPAGDFAKVIADFMPPGLSNLFEAIGEAARGMGGLVKSVKEAADPETQERYRNRPDRWVLIR